MAARCGDIWSVDQESVFIIEWSKSKFFGYNPQHRVKAEMDPMPVLSNIRALVQFEHVEKEQERSFQTPNSHT